MSSYPTSTARPRLAPAGEAPGKPPAAPHIPPPAPSRERRSSRLVLWFGLLGLLALGVSLVVARVGPLSDVKIAGPTAAPVPAERPPQWRPDVAIAHVDVEGGIRSLYPTVPGRVVVLPVRDGEVVESGALLLQIDDALAQLRLKEAKLALQAAREKQTAAQDLVTKHRFQVKMQEASLEAAKKQRAAAEIQHRKIQRTFNDRIGGSADEVEAARRLVEVADANIKAEQAKLDLANAVDPSSAVRLAEVNVLSKQELIEKAELGIRECKLLAPCKGKIIRRFAQVGEVLGNNPMRPALEFCPEGDLIVRAEVEQEFAERFDPGTKVKVTDDATGKEFAWQGEVARVSDWYTARRSVVFEPMPINDIRTLEVTIRLTNYTPGTARSPLRVNQRVRVAIERPAEAEEPAEQARK